MTRLIYKELCYKIVGILYDVHNQLGGGHKEKIYHQAIAVLLEKEQIHYKSEIKHNIIFDKKNIGHYYFDFLIEGKIILEIKRGEFFQRQDMNQIYSYLKIANLKLGILSNFTRHKVRFRRILNIR